MSKGTINVATIVGNVGRDPETRYANSGTEVCNFSIATTDGWGDKETTNWHNCLCFGKKAKFVQEYIVKGDKVAVVGEIRYSSWDDKEGNKKYKTEIVANSVEKIGGTAKKPDAPANQGGSDFPGDQGFDPNDDVPF